MSQDLLIILIVVVAAFVVILIWQQRSFRKLQKGGQIDENLKGWIESTKSDMDEMKREVRGGLDKNTETLQSQLGASNKAINERLDKAAQFMKTIGDEVGQMRELGKSMKDLQDFLQSPKLRGNIGEQILKDLLNQVLPTTNFSTQYKFKEGQVVDAIIKTENGLIPIDSKFPMENAKKLFQAESDEAKQSLKREFAKDVRKHINDIAKKYILPSEGTVDFAIMYVPSEAVYYEVVGNSQDLIDFGQAKKVFLVSPNSFYYFLQAIMLGLKGKKIEEKAKQIMSTLGMIQQESQKFGEQLGVLNRHVTNAKNSMDNVTGEYGKLSGKIDQVKLLE
ncbi:DNA recombination protein RmuC [Patescibacteria group bacterium]